MNIYLDTETIPSQHPDALAEVRSTLKPPGTLKKPESIAAWWATEAEAAAVEAWRRQALDGGTAGELASIAVCGDDTPGWVRCRAPGESEADLLHAFGQQVQRMVEDAAVTGPDGRAWSVGEPFFIAHNAPFDLGFLWRRCRVLGVRLPFALPGPMARTGRDYADTMLAWAGYGGRVSLDTLCRALGITSPKTEGMDGAQVFDRWLAGDVAAIERYNLADALAVREVWHRLQGITAPSMEGQP
ncbi:MAG TPA: hypothetical protein PKC60_00385 [Hydrogenophaga sp.]|uniref:hypothetical protein n=1 Tax=Hydrogenophaga sp. TaxID=1904254 RepID=UPI002CD5481E|nr:hypothetical protein [Hydrogenophaga sp.]HMN91662.1 hypothetical protein [Hydrogenophaga sp.]HMP09966.1 hypothetical protein [Hydrogenophaga sp.]